MTEIEAATRVACEVTGPSGASNARRLGGRYDVEAKMWVIDIPGGENEIRRSLRDPASQELRVAYWTDETWKGSGRPADQPIPEHVHGSLHGQGYYRCRCPICLAAQREARERRKLRYRGQKPPANVHGTQHGYLTYGCRCELCCEAQFLYVAERKLKYAEIGIPPHLHGTMNCYWGLGCRCDACTAANRAKTRAKDAAARARGPHQHGTVVGYNRYGCRCELCRAANTEYRRQYRAQQKGLEK